MGTHQKKHSSRHEPKGLRLEWAFYCIEPDRTEPFLSTIHLPTTQDDSSNRPWNTNSFCFLKQCIYFNTAFDNINILVTVSVFALNINRHSALKTSHSILARNLGYKNFCFRRLMRECLKSMGEEDAGKQIKYRVTKRTGLQTEFRKMSSDSITSRCLCNTLKTYNTGSSPLSNQDVTLWELVI